MEKNTVYKLRFSEYWRIAEHESWFEDMAKNGLHLEEMGLIFAKFIKGEPKNTRYRIDVSSDKDRDITQEEKESYSIRGWKYITSYREFNVFSSPEEKNASELYIDPIEQANSLKKLNKSLVSSAFMSPLFIISILVISYFKWFYNNTPTLFLIDESTFQQIILALFPIYFSITSIKAAIYISTLRRNLEIGIPINHNVPWKKQHILNNISFILYTLIFCAIVILPFTSILNYSEKTLPYNSDNLPIVRLADIEKDPNLVRQKYLYSDDDIDWGNYYKYTWSIFSPTKYESHEEGYISNENSPSVNTRVYELRYESMAKGLISDLMKSYDIESKPGEKIEINHPQFDTLIVFESDDFKDVYASKGKGVIHVRYFGESEIDSIIESVEHKINLISD